MHVLFLITEPEIQAMHVQQPVEVLYTATILKQQGHRVAILDLRVDTFNSLQHHPEPDIIFCLTQTYDRSQCFSLQLSRAQATLEQLRMLKPQTVMVAVGVHGSIEPEMTLRDLPVDWVLPGELEAAVPWFLTTYGALKPARGERAVAAGGPREADVAGLPVPDYNLLDLQRYVSETLDAQSNRFTFATSGLMFANRGCPYSCSYCFVWFGGRMRYRPVARVAEELEQQFAQGIRDFFFLDYTFTLNREWVLDLCHEIQARQLEVRWVCQTRCDRVDAQVLQAMRAAGCVGIYYGVESPWIEGAGLNKQISKEVIDQAMALTSAAGIQTFLFILLGLEGQAQAMADKLLQWLRDVPAIFSARPIQPRPKTKLWSDLGLSATAASWDELYAMSSQAAEEEFWPDDLHQLRDRLLQLSNNIFNVPRSADHAALQRA